LSHDNPQIKKFLEKLSQGNSLTTILQECRIKEGDIRISNRKAKNLKEKKRKNRVVKGLIKNKVHIDDEFKVLNYQVVGPYDLHYTIEMKKTKEADNVLKMIKHFRKNKEYYLSRIAV
jgi:hypothetical protein